MTKFYIPLLALALAGGSASAQQSHDRPLTKQKAITAPTVPNTRTPRASVNRVNREIIWSDDFSNPGNWIAGTIGTASSDTWVIGTTGPTGAYASQVGTIASSTAANGFALFDSDLLCSGNQEATLTIANPVDLSDWTAGVLLQFEQNYKRFYDNVWVDWSTNGTDWTPVQVNADMEHGGDAAATTNPQLTTVDLSDLAGSSTAYFRFRFESTPTSVNPATGGAYPGTLVGCAYSWMVDDVAFTTLPDYEVIMDFAFASMTAEGDEYGQVPASQMPGTLNVGASIINFGLGNQGNVDLHVTFYDEDDNAVPGFSTVIPVGTIPSRDTADVSVDINVPFDLPIGIYTGRFTLTGDEIDLDEDPSDNELSRSFAISTDVYALDGFGVHPEGSEDTRIYGSASFADNSEVYLMTMYTINTQTTATGLHVELVGSPYTVPGADAEIEAFIYADVAQITSETGGVIEGGPVNHALNNITSGTHAITAADVTAGMVYLAFSQPVSLAPGTYYAAVRVKGSGSTPNATTPNVTIWDDNTVPQPAWSSAIYLASDFDEQSGTEGRHSYTNGNAFAIRLIGSPTASINDAAALTDISIFPNPTDGIFRINSDRNEMFFVTVTDVLGQVVHTTRFTGTTTLDLGKVAAGVYNVEVSNRAGRSMHRVSVK